ncbi:MAG: hypothetical protein ACRDZ7_09565, partial [Acidimicrobiia bacterium]
AWGPELLLGVTYWLLGADWLWAKLALALGAALGPVAIFVLAHGITANARARGWAFWLTALWPTTAFWSATGIKDGFVAGLGLAVLAVAYSHPGVWASVTGVLGASMLFLLRPVVAGAVLAAILAADFLPRPELGARRGTQRWISLGLVVLLAGALVLPRFARLVGAANTLKVEHNGQQVSAFGGGLVDEIKEVLSPQSLAQGMVGPLPWLWDEHSASPYRWLFPSAAAWILALPLVGLGAWRAMRERSRAAVLVLVFAFVYLGVYYVAFTGGFFRQRSVIEPIGLMLASSAWFGSLRSRAMVAPLWLMTISLVALTHLLAVSA